ncbi:MAG: hypothetical protein AAGH87_04560 [Pseudomonadota bacterium]
MSDYPNVDAYCALDLSDAGELKKALLDENAVAAEARSQEIRLTDITGQEPAYLSGHARTWYGLHIDGPRRAALDEIDNAMKRIGEESGGTVPAPLIERVEDTIHEKATEEKRGHRANHQEQQAGKYERLDRMRREFNESKARYDRKKMELRREPKVIGWFYWLALVFIGVFEAFINFEAFAGLSFMTPAVALGSTVVIAVLLALSSHLHGQFMAEAQHRFGPQRKPGDLWAAWRMFGLATVGLIVVLAAVWYARANFLQDAIIEASVIGGTPPSWLATVGGSLLMNLGVWIAGVILSYICHDSDPQFPESKKASEKYGRKYDKLRAKLDREVNRELQRIDATAENERDAARNIDRSMHGNARFQAARSQFERMTNQDAVVVGLLNAYKTALASSAADANLRFTRKDDLRKNVVIDVSPAEYSAERIRLKFL